jgi:hypothetical protein
MKVNRINWPWRDVVPMEKAVSAAYLEFGAHERVEFIGRLLDLLATKGLLTVEEVGQLFYEDWKP